MRRLGASGPQDDAAVYAPLTLADPAVACFNARQSLSASRERLLVRRRELIAAKEP
jgi:hypothetical protein